VSAPAVARLGVGSFLAVIALLHLLDRRDPRLHLVSEYALSRPWLLGAGFMALAVGGAGLSAALWRLTPTLRGRAGAACFGVLALAAVLLGLYATDHEGTVPATTPGGRIHDAAAGLLLLSLLLGHMLAWSALGPGAARRVLALLGIVLVALLAPRTLAPSWIGVHQRLLLGTLILGLLVLAARLRRRADEAAAATPQLATVARGGR